MRTQNQESRDRLTPSDALSILKAGNARFQSDARLNRSLLGQVHETSEGQWPFAAILSCIDSRTSAELIFDQGLGDLFSIRIAGNFLTDDILGSLEFACAVAGAKLIVVLGHSHCGAVKGACDGVELGHLTNMLMKLRPALDAVKEPADPSLRTAANAQFVEAVSRSNVEHAVAQIPARSEVLAALHEAGQIEVVGATYDVTSGGVEFF
jgi:carbonic anhydrase